MYEPLPNTKKINFYVNKGNTFTDNVDFSPPMCFNMFGSINGKKERKSQDLSAGTLKLNRISTAVR